MSHDTTAKRQTDKLSHSTAKEQIGECTPDYCVQGIILIPLKPRNCDCK